MAATRREKVERFRALHVRPGAFVIPNPWDVGSARILASLGFEALATTSSGLANALGRVDGQVTRDEVLQHCRELTAAPAERLLARANPHCAWVRWLDGANPS